MITIEKSNKIDDSLSTFYKAILPSAKTQSRKLFQIIATEENKFESQVAKPFLNYMRLKIIQDIRRAVLKADTPTLFTEFVDWEDISTEGKRLSKPAYVSILDKSGTQAAEVARVSAGFDVLNSQSIAWAEKYSAEMVTLVTSETKDALREVIADGMKRQYNKLKIAREINKMPIGLSLPQTTALNNFRDKLIADGVKDALIEKRVQSYYNRLQRQRSRAIARTETSRAVNEGYLQGIEKQEVYNYVQISMAADACHLCTEHEGREFTIEEAHNFLPIHVMCRCAWVVVYSAKKPSAALPSWPSAGHFDQIPSPLGMGELKEDYTIGIQKLLKEQSNINISLEKAREISHSAYNYKGWDYVSIRRAQYMESQGFSYREIAATLRPEYKTQVASLLKDGKNLEYFIENMPSYNGGVYRGLDVKDDIAEAFLKLKNGDIIDMKGVSSWSSELRLSEMFADRTYKPVIIECAKPIKDSASFTAITGKPYGEVLVSNKAKFKVISAEKSMLRNGKDSVLVKVEEVLK